ncbi:hypothetical protein OTU49_014758, partial [Cherax quadricarinatus]
YKPNNTKSFNIIFKYNNIIIPTEGLDCVTASIGVSQTYNLSVEASYRTLWKLCNYIMNQNIIVVVGEVESDSETILETSESGTLVFKNVSCQVNFECTSKASIPIIFSTIFSSVNESCTQTDIPTKSNVSVSVDVNDFIPPLPLNNVTKIKTEKLPKITETEKESLLEQTIEDVILGVNPDEENCSTDQPRKPERTERLCSEAVLFPFSREDVKNPEDSEFSSDNDVAFWEKMKMKSRKRKKYKIKAGGSEKRKYLKYPAGFSNYGTKMPLEENSSILGKITVTLPQPEPTQESKTIEKETDSVKNEVDIKNDDWVTDDEVDAEEEVDIDLAFKLEWKKKRHPYNTKEKNFVCEVCGKLYSKHHYLREHIVRDHNDHEQAKRYPYCCQHCKRLYSGERQLKYHQQQHSGPCEICGLMLRCSGLFWIHRRNHDSQCEACGKIFQTKSSLDMHMKLKHTEKTIPCPLCPRMFPFKFLMNKHVAKAHNSSAPLKHKCDDCDFHARTEGALRIHQRRMHTVVFNCDVCNSSFNTKFAFDEHLALHVGELEFSCQLCMQTFNSQNDLYFHQKTVHEGSTSGTIIEQPALTGQLHHKILMSYPCEICNIKFPTRKKLSRHLLKVHGIDINTARESKEVEESIQVEEMDETATAVMQINVNKEDLQPIESSPDFRENQTIFTLTGGNFQGSRSALLMPANVVPPDVSIVDIDGVRYHVIRGTQ